MLRLSGSSTQLWKSPALFVCSFFFCISRTFLGFKMQLWIAASGFFCPRCALSKYKSELILKSFIIRRALGVQMLTRQRTKRGTLHNCMWQHHQLSEKKIFLFTSAAVSVKSVRALNIFHVAVQLSCHILFPWETRDSSCTHPRRQSYWKTIFFSHRIEFLITKSI